MTRKRYLTEQIMAIDSYLHCILHLQLQVINIPSAQVIVMEYFALHVYPSPKTFKAARGANI